MYQTKFAKKNFENRKKDKGNTDLINLTSCGIDRKKNNKNLKNEINIKKKENKVQTNKQAKKKIIQKLYNQIL